MYVALHFKSKTHVGTYFLHFFCIFFFRFRNPKYYNFSDAPDPPSRRESFLLDLLKLDGRNICASPSFK